MSQKSRVAPGVLQGVAILLLIVAIPTVFFYFAVSRSLEKADHSNTVPTLFGYQYVPVTSDAVSQILNQGSVAIIEEIQPEDVNARDVILYESPSVSQENRVYGSFGISTVQSVSYDGEAVYQVTSYSSSAEEEIAISSSLLRGKVSWSIDYLGSLIDLTTRSYGFLVFVIIPVILFLLFQILSIVLRLTSRYVPEEEGDEEEIQADEETEDGEFLTVEELAQKTAASPKIKSETVSTLLNRAALISPFMEKDLKEEEKAAEQQEDAEKDSGHAAVGKDITFDEKTVTKPQVEQSMREISQLNHGISPEEPKVEEPSLSDRQQEAFKLHQTIEFDMEAIREKMLQEELLKDYEEQDFVKTPDNKKLMDQILIELRETGLDFSFKNIRSENIKIEKNSLGDGFVIKTPKYKASIKVQMEEERR